MKKVLFVCLGNICRSPTAETIMNHYVKENSLTNQIQCDSAGTGDWHVGQLPDKRMREHAKKRGYDLTSRGRQIKAPDLKEFDYIIAMDRSNFQDIRILDIKEKKYQDKIYEMVQFSQKIKDLKEVPDPYFGGEEGFELVLDILEDACQGLLAHLKNSD